MAPPATDGSGAGGAGLQATGLKILYVEDDARSAAELVELAEANGDTVIWEATGSGGLLRAGRDEFDVVILDRMLPDVDGLTILRRLRESGVGTPVLLLSALGRTADRAEGLDAGADDYLAKPFEAEELVARLRALHRRSSGREHSAVIIYGAFERGTAGPLDRRVSQQPQGHDQRGRERHRPQDDPGKDGAAVRNGAYLPSSNR